MKKLCMFLMLGSLISFNAYSEEGFLMNAQQMRDYKNDVEFLECVYSGTQGCQHSKTIEQARKNVAEMKKGYAAGVYAGKKARLDAKADNTLPKISVKEAKNYMKKYSYMSPKQQAEELLDSALLVTTMVMASPGKMEADAVGAKYEGPQTVSKTYTMTKQEVLNSASVVSSTSQGYKSKPAYLPGPETPTVLDERKTYSQNPDMTKVFCKNNKEQITKRNGELNKIEFVTTLVRDSDYNIRIAESKTTILTEETPGDPRENILSADFEGFDITNTSENVASSHDHLARENALRADRINQNKITVLEMLVAKSESLLKNAYSTSNQKEKAKNVEDTRKLMKQARTYYNDVLMNKDQRSKNIVYRYRGLQDTMRKVGL